MVNPASFFKDLLKFSKESYGEAFNALLKICNPNLATTNLNDLLIDDSCVFDEIINACELSVDSSKQEVVLKYVTNLLIDKFPDVITPLLMGIGNYHGVKARNKVLSSCSEQGVTDDSGIKMLLVNRYSEILINQGVNLAANYDFESGTLDFSVDKCVFSDIDLKSTNPLLMCYYSDAFVRSYFNGEALRKSCIKAGGNKCEYYVTFK